IDEIRLSLSLAAAQTRQQTIRLDQTNTGLRQANPIAHPKRKLSAGKIRIVKDRIEASGAIIRRILVPLRPQKRTLKSQIIFVDRSFDCSHVRSHRDATARNRIMLIVSKREVVRVRQIQSPEVPVTTDSQVRDLKLMGPHVTDRRRTHEKPVAIKLHAAA